MTPINWIPLVASSLLTPVITGVVVYLLQLRWQEQMEKRLTRFSKLHERQAEVIAELYKLLVEIQGNINSLASTVSDTTDERRNEGLGHKVLATLDSIKAFLSYAERHHIYLPESLTTRILEFSLQCSHTTTTASLANSYQALASIDESQQEDRDEVLEQLLEEVSKEIPSLRENLEKEFRKLLGG
jgi:hypothetical protein